jgi:MFS transporter, FSR family, fosmidomycin resistance protein
MMAHSIWRLVLLVSLAHAMVHIYELSLTGVEQDIAREFFPDDAERGKEMTGMLATAWRLPFGFGALLAGWLVDRFGSRRLLTLYLAGCSLCCLASWYSRPLAMLAFAMFSMGSFASIYHPAGLALISLSTTPANRAHALGIHGIFGSLGISAAPFLVGMFLLFGLDWRTYYLVLAIPGLLLAIPFYWLAQSEVSGEAATRTVDTNSEEAEDKSEWRSFLALTLLATLQGFVYASVMSFLKRYLGGGNGEDLGYAVGISGFLTAGVLVIGCLGQYIGGRIAHPARLEAQLTWITLANAPCLLWMGMATGWQRIAAAASFSVVHFMYQPIYNSLIAKYTSRRRRSVCYGFSFAMGFGFGGSGATFAGFVHSQIVAYSVLAGVSVTASLVGVVLWRWHNSRMDLASLTRVP